MKVKAQIFAKKAYISYLFHVYSTFKLSEMDQLHIAGFIYVIQPPQTTKTTY